MSALDTAKALGLLLVAALLQLTIGSSFEVANGRADLVLVLLVSIALLRGPLLGAVAGFWAGLVLDVGALQTLGLSSLLLIVAGYASGRFGEVTSRGSPHPPFIAVGLATGTVVLGAGLLHFMLGESVPASELLGGVLLPALGLNLLLTYPLYRLARRIFPVAERERLEARLLG